MNLSDVLPVTNLDGPSSARLPVEGLNSNGARTHCDDYPTPAGRASRTWPQLTDEFWHKRAYSGGLNDLMTSNFESWACFKGHPCLETLDTFVSPQTPPRARLVNLLDLVDDIFSEMR